MNQSRAEVESTPSAGVATLAEATSPVDSDAEHELSRENGSSAGTASDATAKVASTRNAAHLVIALLIVSAVWIALFIVRLHTHQATVDDYLYADVARDLVTPNFIKAALHTGQNAPLVPLLAVPGVALFGLYGALAVQLPILLLLCAGAFVLSRQWLTSSGAAMTSLAVGLSTAVLAYSVELNFSLASTAAVLWCFAAYLRSNRLSNMKWSIAFGFAFAMLLLSRSVAPVYAAPLAVLVGVDVLVGIGRYGQRLAWGALAAVGTTLVFAGPWWLVSGPVAIRYLTNAGYSTSSGYANGGFHLTPATVKYRMAYELFNLGWLESWGLCIFVVAALFCIATQSRARRLPGLLMSAAWVVVTLLILSSSSNMGTGFGLPLIAMTIVLCAVVVGTTIKFGRPAFATFLLLPVSLLAVLVPVAGASQFTHSKSHWWPEPPYLGYAANAGGTDRTNIDLLIAEVAASLGPGNAVVALESGIMNSNGLIWYAGTSTNLQVAYGSDSMGMILSWLPHAHSLVTGNTWDQQGYASFINTQTVQKAAYGAGLHPARKWSLANGDYVLLWNRGPSTSSQFDPVVVKPRNGSQLTAGGNYLLASTPSTFAASKVTFVISGKSLSRPLDTVAQHFVYGWLGGVNASTLPKGQYTITCVAENDAGTRVSSRAITVYVH